MYLVHARLRAPAGAELHASAGSLLRAFAVPADGLEHVAVHPRAEPDPVLGLYLLSPSLEEAEACAARLCRRAFDTLPRLAGWQLLSARAPMVTPFYEHLLGLPGGGGPIRPGPDPST
ncbi:hypothetical protein ACFV4M_34225 [Kitasatospora indigofera]|uniref:hypothetical protein n=1 Tax=Kitasatospora indigofera TaxID=67307 RepID=UPI003655D5C4